MDIYGGQEVHLIDLPEELQKKSEVIHEGSLAIQPCDRVRDRETLEFFNQPVAHWNQQAIAFVKKFNMKKGNTEFDWRFVTMNTEENMFSGDLLLKTPLETTNLSEELINLNLAVRLKKVLMEPKPQGLRPSANIKKIILNSCPELLPAKREVSLQKPQVILPQGVEVGRYSNEKAIQAIQKSKNVPSRESRKPRVAPRQAPTMSPVDIFVVGQEAKPPFGSLDACEFTKPIKSCLETNASSLTKVQAHSWPQIACGRSIIIISASTSSSVSIMTFLPPLINNLMVNKAEEPRLHNKSSTRPTAILIASTSSQINDIQRMCTSFAPMLKIAVLGMESKAIQIINGCDLLLSTPAAFVRTVEGTTIDLFERDRIKTLAFIGVDQMRKFDSEINEIVRRCSYGSKNVEKNPQIIVTSNVWFKNIAKFKALIPPSRLVLCVESFIEVAALSGIKIALEISSSNEAKFGSTRKYLESVNFKTKRTVVVVNDDATLEYLVQKFGETSVPAKTALVSSSEVDKRNWLQEERGNFSVLIATDAVLEAMRLNQVQNLVHFSLPRTWSIFTQRFSTLMCNFYKSIEKKDDSKTVATKIFIDEEKNVKEFVHLVKFMESREMDGIPPAITESVKVKFLLHLRCLRIYLFHFSTVDPVGPRRAAKVCSKSANLRENLDVR